MAYRAAVESEVAMPRTSLCVFATSAIFATSIACTENGSDGSRNGTERITVGDTIIVRSSGPGVWGDSATLVEELRIGSAEGGDEYTFGEIGDIAVGSDGIVYIADRKVKTVRAYDSTGRYIRSIGRTGKGPGEYETPVDIALLRDGRVLIYDPQFNRVLMYTSTGASIRAMAMNPMNHWFTRELMTPDTSGNIYVRIMIVPMTRNARHDETYVRFDTAGTLRDTVPMLHWPQETRFRVFYDPIGVHAINHRGNVVSGYSDRFSIEVRPQTGKRTRIERVGETPIPIDAAERKWLDSMTAESYKSPYTMKEGPLQPVRASKPLFQQIAIDEDDRVWVRRHMPSVQRPASDTSHPYDRWYEPMRPWDVFDADGTYMGRITLPPTTQIYFARGDRAWGVVENEDGIQTVVRWRIQPAGN
jgi:hypothetical protein